MASSTMSSGDFRTRADWRRVEHLYKQFSTIVSNNGEIPTEIVGALANSLGRVVAFYEDNEPLFVRDLLELWSWIDKLKGSNRDLFRNLYFDRRLDRYRDYNPPPDSGIRRRPRPFEAAVETCRRLKDLNNVRHALSSLQCGAILGGSVSYGRFYNITGSSAEFGSKASDTDLLVILKEYEQLGSVAESLSSIGYLDRDSVDSFRRRAQIFPLVKKEQNTPCIFSHKLVVADADTDPILQGADLPGGYNLSLHVFSFADFDFLTLRDIAILDPPSSSEELDRTLHDYRDTDLPPEN